MFAAAPGRTLDETAPVDVVTATPYERSKQLALTAAGPTELVIVNPVAIYCPGPTGSAVSPPGGFALVLRERLARAALLASARGRPGGGVDGEQQGATAGPCAVAASPRMGPTHGVKASAKTAPATIGPPRPALEERLRSEMAVEAHEEHGRDEERSIAMMATPAIVLRAGRLSRRNEPAAAAQASGFDAGHGGEVAGHERQAAG